MKVYIGLDIGGTKAYAGLITEKGDILRTKEVPSRVKDGNAAIVDTIAGLIRYIANGTPFAGIGIGLAGHIDHVQNRIMRESPNFRPSFRKLDLVSALFKQFHVPVVLENDAKAYALGEAVFGRGKGYRRVVVVTVGTGIGGGLVQDGKIIHGKNNLAGEFGKMYFGEGKNWEQVAAGGPFNRHKDEDKEAELLGTGFRSLLNVLDPDIIVVGGGVSREPGLISRARGIAHTGLHYTALKKTPIVKSSLLHKAPILGAMLVVRGM
jgi:glucokinase